MIFSSETSNLTLPIINSMIVGISSSFVDSRVLSALETIGDTQGREMRSHSRYNAECHQNFEMASHPIIIIIIPLIHHHNHHYHCHSYNAESHQNLDRFPTSLACGRASGLGTLTNQNFEIGFFAWFITIFQINIKAHSSSELWMTSKL